MAKEVTISQAERVATNWMMERSEYSNGTISVKEFFAVNVGSKTAYYVFNMNPNGFVMVSADDIANPIIGYSTTSGYKVENQPSQFTEWMEKVKGEINQAASLNLTPLEKTSQEWGRLSKESNIFIMQKSAKIQSAGPLLSTTWDQGSVLRLTYNKYCPVDPLSIFTFFCTPTGCVATAMSQILKYYNYPTKGRGTYNFTHNNYGNLKADFGSTFYKWSSMPSELGVFSDTISINAIAQLMYHCGVSVTMNYGTNESEAFPDSARNAIVNYFDYSLGTALVQRNINNTSDQWQELMKSELDNNRPVLYFGYGKGGHAFVMDGYQGQAYFHFNWGWSGSNDGYYYLGSLTPGWFNFSQNEGAVINIVPTHNSVQNDITPVLFIYQNKWTASEGGGTTDPIFLINSNPLSNTNIDYTIQVESSASSWLSVSTQNGTTTGNFSITAQPNTSGSTRSGRVIITATTSNVFSGSKMLYVNVDQNSSTSINAVDVALVIDCSGSMGTSYYIEPAKTAAKNFVGFMQNDDNIAVVSFSDYATVNTPLKKITSAADKTTVQNTISSIFSGGNTSVGAGLQYAQSELNKGRTSSHQAIILLSDGYENTSPYVASVLPSIPANTDIYTIALGSDSDINLLNNIASQTGGAYYFSPDASKLQEIYNFIRGTITNQQVYATTTSTLSPGSSKTIITPVDGLTKEVLFSITFSSGNIDLELTSPSGKIINSLTVDPNISFSKGTTYIFCKVKNPEGGNWTLKIIGTSLTSSTSVASSVQGTSLLSLTPFFDKKVYESGQQLQLNCSLMADKTPITGATVIATIQRPDFSISSYYDALNEIGTNNNENNTTKLAKNYSTYATDVLTLYDDGLHGDGAANDGLYSNYYVNTSIAGSYSFNIAASGTINGSNSFKRESSFSTVVNKSTKPSVVSLSSLPNGTKEVTGSPLLKWNKSTNAVKYNLQLSYSSASSQSASIINIIDTLTTSDNVLVKKPLLPGKIYFWHVRAVNSSNQYSDWSEQWSFTTAYGASNENICYPNPFNPDNQTVTFRFKVVNPGNISIKILDVSNRLVKEISPSKLYGPGIWEDIYWDGKNDNNQTVSNGVYFYIVENSTGGRTIGKLAILK